MSYVSREIHTRQCFCTGCNCHTALSIVLCGHQIIFCNRTVNNPLFCLLTQGIFFFLDRKPTYPDSPDTKHLTLMALRPIPFHRFSIFLSVYKMLDCGILLFGMRSSLLCLTCQCHPQFFFIFRFFVYRNFYVQFLCNFSHWFRV